ncbi:excinuclease ABC subunit C [Candidatus Woesearchaeota archaeon]|nr:excinuclease ABC subunit C [Candidatus Woesearchaeota archaeon]
MIDTSKIPLEPGCYVYKDARGQIIYIGKAKSLRKRVKSYFTRSSSDEKTQALVAETADVDFFVTSNEVEAFILENNLIKKHKPKYNINLKNSDRYAHILVTDEQFPRILTARNKKLKGRYYGPFVSGEHRRHIVKTLRQAFRIRTCKTLPKKECLRFHIGLCSAPCINKISEQHYAADIAKAEDFLKGNVKELEQKLRTEMQLHSSRKQFEIAQDKRDQLFALQSLTERQKFELQQRWSADLINYLVHEGTIHVLIFGIDKGILHEKSEFDFPLQSEWVEEFLVRYYADHEIPGEILLPTRVDEAIRSYLEKIRGAKVIVRTPKRGAKKELLELVKTNIHAKVVEKHDSLSLLAGVLRLQEVPEVIECFDISHSSGAEVVASMVQFRHGKPDNSNYRRFKIRSDVNDDVAAIKEVVSRRYSYLSSNGLALPHLVVIDGGKGQLHGALEALQSLSVKLPVISLAKKDEEIFVPGLVRPIRLKKTDKALQLLMSLRDEAHRFAITYHRLRRGKRMKNEL